MATPRILEISSETFAADSTPPCPGLVPSLTLRRHRMVHPLIALAIDVLLGAERPLVEHHLGTLIDHRAGVAGKRHAVLLALEEVLPHLRPDLFQQEAQMRRDRIVP